MKNTVSEITVERKGKRSLILDTTLRLISENGFHGTPISLIAKEAGIGAGTIYRYFKNKDELIYELFKSIQHQVIEAMLQGYDRNASYKEQFETLWLNMTRYYMGHPCEFQFVEQHHYAPNMSSMTRAASFKILQPVMLFFINAKKNKAIKDLPLYTIVALVHGPIVMMSKLHIDHNQKLSEERINQACQACWDAVKFK